MNDFGIKAGLAKGWKTYVWVMKILLPISFLIALLKWTGWLNQAEFILRPVMSLLSLPPEAALPLLIGMATGPSGAVAAIVVLPFTKVQITLMAIFFLTAHSLPQETAVQAKSGFGAVRAVLFRILAAGLTVAAVAAILDASPEPLAGAVQASSAGPAGMGVILQEWFAGVVQLAITLLILIMVCMVVLEVFKVKGWIRHVVKVFSPFLRAMGLNHNVAVLWVAALFFGLATGAAILLEESRSGRLTQDELEAVHLSIGINHGLLDDPLLFLSLGASAFWVYVPRLIMAVLAVRILTLWRAVRTRSALKQA